MLARHISRTRTVARVTSLSPDPHGHVHVSVSPRLALTSYFSQLLTHSFPFIQHLKFLENLRTPHNESIDSTDEFLLPTGCEPKAYDLKETYVEPYTRVPDPLTTLLLLLPSPQFSMQGFLEDVEYDDPALEKMLHNAHRVHVHHSQREGLSDGQSSSVSERTGRLVGERTVRLVGPIGQELNVRNAQIRTLLDRPRFLAECQGEIKKHEFQVDCDRRSVRKLGENFAISAKKKFTALKLKNFNDEINNFFMNGFWSKTGKNGETRCRPWQVTSQVTKFRDKTLKANGLGLSWTDEGCKSLLIVTRR